MRKITLPVLLLLTIICGDQREASAQTPPREINLGDPTSMALIDKWIKPYDSLNGQRQNAITRAVAHVSPGTVSITVTQVKTRWVPTVGWWGPFFPDYRREAYEMKAMGSGVVVDPAGYILTNGHVVENASEINVNFPDGRQVAGKVLAVDEGQDVAVVKIEETGLTAVEMGNSDSVIIGEWAIAIGNPYGFLLGESKPTVTVGVVSAVNRDFEPQEGRVYRSMIQTDAAINPGNSGGPLVNSLGQLIGINTFIYSPSGGSIGLGFAIPINRARRVLEEVRQYGKVRDLYLGFEVRPLTRPLARHLKLANTDGVIVTTVERDSPAEQAGLKEGDVLTQINGRPIKQFDDLVNEVRAVLVGDTWKCMIMRDGKPATLNLVIGTSKK